MAPNPQEEKARELARLSLIEKSLSESSLLHRSLKKVPCLVSSAKGSYLYLFDGRRILDACCGAGVSCIGHGDPEVIRALCIQAKKVAYVHTIAYSTKQAEALAKYILEHREEDGYFDHGLVKAFFVCSGSEANEAALKCAMQYWFEKGELERKFFVARKQAYHGNTIGAMSISSMHARKVPYENITLPHVSFVGAADIYHRCETGETEEQFVERLILEIETEFLRLGPKNIISFIGETVSGAALGAMKAPKGYWRAVRALCDKHDILLHLDEVMCGMGRMGTLYAFTQEDIRPDIVTIGKGLGGGYAPIGGLLINNKIVDALRQGSAAFNHGQTYQAHPVSCATALAVQTIVKRRGLISRCKHKGGKLGAMLRDEFAGCEHVGDIRGGGLFWALEFVEDKASKRPFPKDLNFGKLVEKNALKRGVAVYPGAGTMDGNQGDHVLVAPAYNVSNGELAFIVSQLKRAYEESVEPWLTAKL